MMAIAIALSESTRRQEFSTDLAQATECISQQTFADRRYPGKCNTARPDCQSQDLGEQQHPRGAPIKTPGTI